MRNSWNRFYERLLYFFIRLVRDKILQIKEIYIYKYILFFTYLPKFIYQSAHVIWEYVTLLQWRPMPIKKLSGFMSLWMKCLQWTNSILPIIWSANIKTVLIVNLREQKVKRSSRDGPKRSITRTLYSRSVPYLLIKRNFFSYLFYQSYRPIKLF